MRTNQLTFDLLRGGWMIVSSSLPSQMITLEPSSSAPETTSGIDEVSLIGVQSAVPIVDATTADDDDTSLFTHFMTQSSYWTYDGNAFGLSDSITDAIRFKISGSTDNFTIEIYDSNDKNLGFLIMASDSNTFSVGSNTNDSYSQYQLLARYQTTLYPLNGLLPGEALICGESGYEGTAFVIKGNPIPKVQLNSPDYIQPVGATSTGDLILKNIQSMKLGPSTQIILSTSDMGFNQTFYWDVPQTFDETHMDEPQGIWETVGVYNTSVSAGNLYEGNWALYTDQGLLNSQGIPTPCSTYPDTSQFVSLFKAPTSQLPNNQPIEGKIAYTLTGNQFTFFIIPESNGQVSFQDVNTGMFFYYDGESFTTTDDDTLRSIIDMRFRNNLSTLLFGQVALFENRVFGSQTTDNGPISTIISHDLALENLPDDLNFKSIAIGPSTSVYLFDSYGNPLNDVAITENIADTSSYGSVASLQIERTVLLQNSLLTASSHLIDDFIPDSNGDYTYPAMPMWRTVLTVKDDDGRPVNGATVSIKMEGSGGLNLYVGGIQYPMTENETLTFTTDFAGTITALNIASDVISPTMCVQLDGMEANEWTMVHLDQGLHESLMVVNESEIENQIPQSDGRAEKNSPFKGVLKEGEGEDLSNALNALFSTINYENGNEAMSGEVYTNAAQSGSATAVSGFKSAAVAHTTPHKRSISTKHLKHKHFGVSFHPDRGSAFTSYSSGNHAMGALFAAAGSNGTGAIRRVTLHNDSSFLDWLDEVVGEVEDFVVSVVDDVESAVEEGWDEFTNGIIVAFRTVAGEIVEGIIDAVEQIVELGKWLLAKFEVALADIVDFFSYLFNWSDIQETAASISAIWADGIQMMTDSIQEAQDAAEGVISDATKNISDYLNETMKNLDQNQYDVWNSENSSPNSHTAILKNNYVLEKVNQNPSITDESHINTFIGGITDTVSEFVNCLMENNSSDLSSADQSSFQEAVNTFIENATQRLENTSFDSFSAFGASMLGLLNEAINLVGEIAIILIDKTADLFRTLLKLIDDLFTWEWNIPIISDLFKIISGGLPLNGLNLTTLLFAIPINVIDKTITYGDENQYLATSDSSEKYSVDDIFDKPLTIAWATSTIANTIFEPWSDSLACQKLSSGNISPDTQGYVQIVNLAIQTITRVWQILATEYAVVTGKDTTTNAIGLAATTMSLATPFINLVASAPGVNAKVMTTVGVVNLGLAITHSAYQVNENTSAPDFLIGASRIPAAFTGTVKFLRDPALLESTGKISEAGLLAADVLLGAAATGFTIAAAVEAYDD